MGSSGPLKPKILSEQGIDKKLYLFRSLFKGREDVLVLHQEKGTKSGKRFPIPIDLTNSFPFLIRVQRKYFCVLF
jgi:hypothetical protein